MIEHAPFVSVDQVNDMKDVILMAIDDVFLADAGEGSKPQGTITIPACVPSHSIDLGEYVVSMTVLDMS